MFRNATHINEVEIIDKPQKNYPNKTALQHKCKLSTTPTFFFFSWKNRGLHIKQKADYQQEGNLKRENIINWENNEGN